MTSEIDLIIVDDEEEAREGLRVIVNNIDGFNLIGVAENGLQAISLINSEKPDVILLDIQMPEINGFEVLNNIELEYNPFVIFVTAYDNYAIRAFEHHAIDYILKPFTDARLIEALEHAMDRVNQLALSKKIGKLLEEYKKEKLGNEPDTLINPKNWKFDLSENSKIVVKSFGKVYFVDVSEIIWVQAYDYYVKIHVKDKFYLVRQSLKSMEKTLPKSVFYRIHKSNIVNINHIANMSPRGNGDYEFILSTGVVVNMSRNYKDCLKSIQRSVQ